MRWWNQRLGIALFCLALAACGKNPQTEIAFDSSVPTDQKSSLEKDWERLGTLNLTPVSSNDLAVVNIPEFGAQAMRRWLLDRVKVIVGENYQYNANSTKEQIDPNASPQFFLLSSNFESRLGATELVTVMKNLGAELYLKAKKYKILYTLEANMTQIRCNSTRSGVIQIGKGLFTANRIQSSPVDSTVNSLLRLAVLFHEARHSDGNGDYAAFPHADCPVVEDWDYSGKKAACEKNRNGPYAVQAVMVKNFYSACTQCTSAERVGMEKLIADYQSRIFNDAEPHDDRPEALP